MHVQIFLCTVHHESFARTEFDYNIQADNIEGLPLQSIGAVQVLRADFLAKKQC